MPGRPPPGPGPRARDGDPQLPGGGSHAAPLGARSPARRARRGSGWGSSDGSAGLRDSSRGPRWWSWRELGFGGPRTPGWRGSTNRCACSQPRRGAGRRLAGVLAAAWIRPQRSASSPRSRSRRTALARTPLSSIPLAAVAAAGGGAAWGAARRAAPAPRPVALAGAAAGGLGRGLLSGRPHRGAPSPGPFDERIFLFAEDLELGMRAAEDGVATWFRPDARVLHLDAHSSVPAFAGEPVDLLARRRRAVIGELRGQPPLAATLGFGW